MRFLSVCFPLLVVAMDFSYDPFLYDEDEIHISGFISNKVNINGKWYKKGDVFEDSLIYDVQNRCVVLKENDDINRHCIGKVGDFNVK